MSQSRTANIKHSHSADLKSLDLISALLLHIMVFTVIGVLMYWQQQHRPSEPLKRIEVMMISAKELAKLEQQARNRPKQTKHAKPKKIKPKPRIVKPPKPKPPVAKPVEKIKPKAKPAPKPKPVPKPKAVPKPEPVKEKPPTPAKVKPDENFDPFAPLASSTDKKVSAKKASTSRPELADLVGKQLSTSEKERYIALMQAAVQNQWKVPISTTQFTDPLVEMTLLPNGDVASVKILESSGNDVLDASLIRAIKAAAPFQLPRRQFEFFRVNRLRFHPLK